MKNSASGELRGLIGRSDPVDVEALAIEVTSTGLGAELRGRSASLTESPRCDAISLGAPRRASRIATVFAVATISAVAAVAALRLQTEVDPAQPAYAAEAIEVAMANPRLYVSAPGWRVTGVDQFDVDGGEIYLSDGTYDLQITWYPARYYDTYYDDRTSVGPYPTTATVLGQELRTVRYDEAADTDFATILPARGAVFVEIRGDLGSLAYYREVLASVEVVDIDTWLGALPDDVVFQDERSDLIDQMLEGVPLPAGFDDAALREDHGLGSTRALQAQVVTTVGCGWYHQLESARQTGNEPARREASAALAGSSQWPVVADADPDGFPYLLKVYVRSELNDGPYNFSDLCKELAAEGPG